MAKATSVPVNDRLRNILQSLKDKIGGVESIFLVDLTDAEILVSFPKNESTNKEFIGTISANNVHRFEAHSKTLEKGLYVTEMELRTDEGQQVYVSRVRDDLLLCVVGNTDFKVGFAKMLCESDGGANDDIIATFDEMGLGTPHKK